MYVQMYMTCEPVTVSPDCDVAEAMRRMKRGNCRRLPVVDGDNLVGIVTLRDLYNACRRT